MTKQEWVNKRAYQISEIRKQLGIWENPDQDYIDAEMEWEYLKPEYADEKYFKIMEVLR